MSGYDDWDIETAFPPLDENKIVLVLYSGGKDSSLLGALAIDRYGAENVIAVKISMTNVGFNYYDDVKIAAELKQSTAMWESLGGKYFKEITNNNMPEGDTYTAVSRALINYGYEFGAEDILDVVQYVFTAHNKPERDMMRIVNLPEITNGTYDEVLSYIKNHEEYNYIEEAFGLEKIQTCTRLTYEETDVRHLTESTYCLQPFGKLFPFEILKLANDTNHLDIIHKSFSCSSDLHEYKHHCGKTTCFHCQQRKSAYKLAGIEDPTYYLN